MESCTRRSILGIGALLLAAGMAGCGGGSGGDQASKDNSRYPTRRMDRIRPTVANAGIVREILAAKSSSVSAAGPVKVVNNDGWTDITGVVRIEGAAPAQRPVTITKDEQVCAPGGKPVFDGSMVVGSDNGIGNVLVFVSSKVSADWEHDEHKALASAELKGEQGFDQKNCVFTSHVFAMRSSQKLEVLNSDPIGHNTNISDFGFNVTISPNDSTTFDPVREKKTPFQVRCSIHPWMQAWMITRGNPYFAVTKADGTFTIPRVPAGVELEFKVWHERSRMSKFTVNGEEESRKFVRTLKKDAPAELNVTVQASQFDG